ncbi:TIGR00730 family Rossman fold protein [Candidatus Parcubacteria bacterium]|nr:MAG: TIGR00730 family Rossman fold protein [Candidatus Parcubacteria bacterium]
MIKKSGQPPKMSEITWRIFRIMAEFVEGFQFLSQFNREVTIFGSARTPADNHWYQEARRLGMMLAKNNYVVVTGGGPGIMEAANRGAYEAGGISVGINIQLPMEQRINPYVTKARGFYYFFTRKVILAASAQAYVYFPGGFGTMDELFEILTLIQTGKSEKIPVVLVGKEYWQGLKNWIVDRLRNEYQTISPGDVDIFTIVDSAEEAFEIVKKSKERNFF